MTASKDPVVALAQTNKTRINKLIVNRAIRNVFSTCEKAPRLSLARCINTLSRLIWQVDSKLKRLLAVFLHIRLLLISSGPRTFRDDGRLLTIKINTGG